MPPSAVKVIANNKRECDRTRALSKLQATLVRAALDAIILSHGVAFLDATSLITLHGESYLTLLRHYCTPPRLKHISDIILRSSLHVADYHYDILPDNLGTPRSSRNPEGIYQSRHPGES